MNLVLFLGTNWYTHILGENLRFVENGESEVPLPDLLSNSLEPGRKILMSTK